MKFVSVLTSDARGGAEFGAASMLEALIAEGHEVMLLSDQPEIAAELGVPSEPIELGAKLSTRSYWRLAVTWPLELRRLRAALMAQMPYDVLIVHYKKEQLLASMLPAALRTGPALGRVGTGSVPDAKGARPAGLPGGIPPSRGGHGSVGRHHAIPSAISASPLDKVVVVPECRSSRRDPISARRPEIRASGARHPRRRIRRRLHLEAAPEEAQRRGGRGGGNARWENASDHGR